MIFEIGGGRDLRSIFRIFEQSKVFRKVAADPRILNIAKFILNDNVFIFQSRLNYKAGITGRRFFWHSDFETWHGEDGMPRMRALSASIMMTNNYMTNSPLMLIPGSHKLFVACSGKTPTDNYKNSLSSQYYGTPTPEIVTDLVEKYGLETVTGKAGSVILFDVNTLHGSNGNITPWPRHNAFIVYCAKSNPIGEPYETETPRGYFAANREKNPEIL